MKQLTRNKLHKAGRSHDVSWVEYEGRKIKLTYKAYNAAEIHHTELFDGTKWIQIANLYDLGESPNSSAYNILSPTEREARADKLNTKAKKYIKLFL